MDNSRTLEELTSVKERIKEIVNDRTLSLSTRAILNPLMESFIENLETHVEDLLHSIIAAQDIELEINLSFDGE